MTQYAWTVLVHTVESDESKYAYRQYSSAKKAWELQDIVGRPSA